MCSTTDAATDLREATTRVRAQAIAVEDHPTTSETTSAEPNGRLPAEDRRSRPTHRRLLPRPTLLLQNLRLRQSFRRPVHSEPLQPVPAAPTLQPLPVPLPSALWPLQPDVLSCRSMPLSMPLPMSLLMSLLSLLN